MLMFRHNPLPELFKESLRAEFKALAFFAIAGLDTYAGSLSVTREAIHRPAFVRGLVAKVKTENESILQQVIRSAPESVEDREGIRIERYSQGVVNISSRPQQSKSD